MRHAIALIGAIAVASQGVHVPPVRAAEHLLHEGVGPRIRSGRRFATEAGPVEDRAPASGTAGVPGSTSIRSSDTSSPSVQTTAPSVQVSLSAAAPSSRDSSNADPLVAAFPNAFHPAALSPDGAWLVAANTERAPTVYDTSGREATWSLNLGDLSNRSDVSMAAAASSPAGTWLAVWLMWGEMRGAHIILVYNTTAAPFALASRLYTGIPSVIWSNWYDMLFSKLKFSPDGKWIATIRSTCRDTGYSPCGAPGSDLNDVVLFKSTAAGDAFYRHHALQRTDLLVYAVREVAFSPDGRWLVVGGYGDYLVVYNMSAWRAAPGLPRDFPKLPANFYPCEHRCPTLALDINPASRVLAYSGLFRTNSGSVRSSVSLTRILDTSAALPLRHRVGKYAFAEGPGRSHVTFVDGLVAVGWDAAGQPAERLNFELYEHDDARIGHKVYELAACPAGVAGMGPYIASRGWLLLSCGEDGIRIIAPPSFSRTPSPPSPAPPTPFPRFPSLAPPSPAPSSAPDVPNASVLMPTPSPAGPTTAPAAVPSPSSPGVQPSTPAPPTPGPEPPPGASAVPAPGAFPSMLIDVLAPAMVVVMVVVTACVWRRRRRAAGMQFHDAEAASSGDELAEQLLVSEPSSPRRVGSTAGSALTLPSPGPPRRARSVRYPSDRSGAAVEYVEYSPRWVTAVKEIGCGAFGVVKLGVHSATQERVAVKCLRASGAMENELRLLRDMRHPRIVALKGFYMPEGCEDALMYMEYVAGGSLFDVVSSQGRIYEAGVRRCMRDTLSGLEYLHSRGVVHRDIKPHNLLVDGDGRVKLADFGCCKEGVDGTAETGVKGTPQYMAPECVQGKVSVGSDIWSLGATAVHLASGKMPWHETGLSGMPLCLLIANGAGRAGHHPAVENLSPGGRRVVLLCFAAEARARPACGVLLRDPFFSDVAVALPGAEGIDNFNVSTAPEPGDSDAPAGLEQQAPTTSGFCSLSLPADTFNSSNASVVS
eukprot:TRINITY_DN2823_c0_g4_i3.p1 TRINITY_DN2823_c0_g4~~TRINITY_DN2823_c0_g4_i3.p1  ORF type:complete len:990 (+),score=156.27 TRINITY_DN2823_c0_g4_i3:99-3068(+)